MSRLEVELVGKVPLLMCRYAGEQPSAKKAPRGQKTQIHIDENRKADWLRCAYYDEGRGWFIPPENIEAALAAGAAKFRMKTEFKWAVTVENDFVPLLIPDSKGTYLPADKPIMTYYVPDHIDVRGVVLQKSTRIDRCRPLFRQWALQFTLLLEDSINKQQIADSLARTQLGDFRPRFGRFNISKLKEL